MLKKLKSRRIENGKRIEKLRDKKKIVFFFMVFGLRGWKNCEMKNSFYLIEKNELIENIICRNLLSRSHAPINYFFYINILLGKNGVRV